MVMSGAAVRVLASPPSDARGVTPRAASIADWSRSPWAFEMAERTPERRADSDWSGSRSAPGTSWSGAMIATLELRRQPSVR